MGRTSQDNKSTLGQKLSFSSMAILQFFYKNAKYFFLAVGFICDTITYMKIHDVIIVGAGAGGLKAAAEIESRHKSYVILDMGNTPARKIAVSGGGNCNFTNTNADYTRYFGQNPDFVRSALAQFSPIDMLNWVKSKNIEYTEREPGRFFCKNGAQNIVNALLSDINVNSIQSNQKVLRADKQDDVFAVFTENGDVFRSKSLIIATGGISYSNLGVSDVGFSIAKHFGHKIVPFRPGLCPLKTDTFSPDLAGISLPVEITTNSPKRVINDNLLFTHFGIGGPAVYRASLSNADNLIINFVPNVNLFEKLKQSKQTNGRKNLVNILTEILPNKFAHFICKNDDKNIADYKDSQLQKIANQITHFEIKNLKPMGMQNAEITFGGIDTKYINSKNMESKICKNLFFAGEVLDVSGDLGGFNLQWAFSSGFLAGKNA